jgi:hypothetical protein
VTRMHGCKYYGETPHCVRDDDNGAVFEMKAPTLYHYAMNGPR